MANMLQSAQVKSTCAPQYYTDYLSKLATAGQQAQQNAQYVGAQPLQEQAFETMGQSAGQYQPFFQTGAERACEAAQQDISGAAAPYLQAAATRGGLSAAAPYLGTAAMINPAALAKCYMNPYVSCVVQSMSDIGQRNIQRNLAPQATAAAVGSGQFGSQRGAQVLGQVEADATRDLNNQIAQMLSSGYGQALQAAGQKQALLGQLGQTAGSLEQQQSQLLGQLGQTAGSLTGQQAQTLNQAAQTLGNLAQTGQAANLACINALATLGGQQQTIAQNQQLFPMSTLSQLSQLLQGYNIPVTTKTRLCKSGLENIGSVAGLLGTLLQPNQISQKSTFDLIKGILPSIFGGKTGSGSGSGSGSLPVDDYVPSWMQDLFNSQYTYCTEKCGYYCCGTGRWIPGGATGGLVSIGCASTQSRGALPKE